MMANGLNKLGLGAIVWWSLPVEITTTKDDWNLQYPDFPLPQEPLGDPLRRALFALDAPAGSKRLVRPLKAKDHWAVVIETPTEDDLSYSTDFTVKLTVTGLEVVKKSFRSDSYAYMLEQLMDSADWMKLHDATMGDETLAAAGAIKLREKLAEDPEAEEAMKKVEELERLQETLQGLEDLQQDNPDNPAIGMEIDSTQQQLERLGQEVDDALGDGQVIGAIREAMGKAAEDTENAIQVAGGWGHDQGTLKEFLFNKDLVNCLSQDKIKRILDLAGKMREVISAERANRPRKGPQKVKLAMGDDLHRVVPTELAMFGDPETEDVFLRRYTEGALMLYEREEKPRMGKGPFEVCVDESGSMSGVKEEWAKALTFAMCQQAIREKRDFAGIAFGAKGQTRIVVKPTPQEFMAWFLQNFNAAGTDFETPLEEAADKIGEELTDADIFFITDGEASCSDKFLMGFAVQKRTKKFKVIGIQIGYTSLDGMKPFTDVAFKLDAEHGAQGLEAVIEEVK